MLGRMPIMNISSFIQSMLKFDSIALPVKTFQVGQIFTGQVVKLLPNQIAEVQIGNQKVKAQLEAPLLTGERYWFEVKPSDGKIHLKVLSNHEGIRQKDSTSSPDVLLRNMDLPLSKENKAVLNFFIKEELPISKENIHHASNLLKGERDQAELLRAMKQLILRDLPLTKDFLTATIQGVKSDSTYTQIQELQELLKERPLSMLEGRLHSVLEALASSGKDVGSTQMTGNMNWEDRLSLVGHFKKLAHMIGLDYESDLQKFLTDPHSEKKFDQQVLKSLLIRLVQEENEGPLKQAAEQLLNKITSTQLSSFESGIVQQYVMQIPLTFKNMTTELTIQWSGKKKEDGQIDPNYCRVLFYLDLEFIHEVIVDMQVQNRIMTINVINDTEGIKTLATPFIDTLKENLAQMDYKVSSIQFQKPSEDRVRAKKKEFKLFHSTYPLKGVDFRI